MENFAALSAVGAERITANELRKLGLSVLETGFARIRFSADIAGCYRALMGLRTADRVLWEAARFPAGDFDALFEGARNAVWESFVPRGWGLHVAKVRTARSKLQSVTSIQAVVHKAAAERLCRKYGLARLPDTADTPVAEVRVYLDRDEAALYLDLSGEPLFRRGYRTEGGAAPLRETTAAALLFLAAWRRKHPLCDPFCGSGTIAIEAAMYAWDMAPGLGRTFTLSSLLPADPVVERAVREEFLSRVNFERTIRIYGSDTDVRAISQAKSNLIRAWEIARGRPAHTGGRGIRTGTELPAGAERAALPDFRVASMAEARAKDAAEDGEAGFIITNPPYGIRLGGEEEAAALYGSMANLARNFPGWKLAVITNQPGFESHFGTKADSCREITNGPVETYFFQYERL